MFIDSTLVCGRFDIDGGGSSGGGAGTHRVGIIAPTEEY